MSVMLVMKDCSIKIKDSFDSVYEKLNVLGIFLISFESEDFGKVCVNPDKVLYFYETKTENRV